MGAEKKGTSYLKKLKIQSSVVNNVIVGIIFINRKKKKEGVHYGDKSSKRKVRKV